MSTIDKVQLPDGKSIPCLGIGTFRLEDSSRSLTEIFSDALNCGLNMIDTAQGYANERLIGQALHEIGVNRNEYHLIAKLDDPYHETEKAKVAIERTMSNLKTDYIDVFLIHSPNSDVIRRRCVELGLDETMGWTILNAQAWEVLEEYKKLGHIGSIGVSNFDIHHLMGLYRSTDQFPCINQIKTTVGSIPTQEKLFDFCKKHDIMICGYSPLGKGNLLDQPEISDVASHYGKSSSQVLLRYIFEMGFCQIVKTSDYKHMLEDIDIFDFELNENDRNILRHLMLPYNWARVRDPDTGLKKE